MELYILSNIVYVENPDLISIFLNESCEEELL